MSCAWPDPEVGPPARCGILRERRQGRCRRSHHGSAPTPEFFAAHSIADLDSHIEHWLGQQGRITHPMVKRPGRTHYQPIGWDEAFGLIGEELNALGSPDEAIFYTSGRASNESAFAYQLFARAFGTNNMPDCSNMCHESTSIALQESIGIGKASVSIEDVYHAEADHPGRPESRAPTTRGCFPRWRSPSERRQDHLDQSAARGRIGPVQESAGAAWHRRPWHRLTDLHLPIKLNGDLALFQAIGSLLVEWDALDHDFIDTAHQRFRAWRDHVSAVDWEVVTDNHRAFPGADHRGRADCCGTRRPPSSAGRWD